MDARKLRAFVAVAEELHFGRAARRLHVSQPPLSVLIRTLESELGVRLFHRTSRHVSMTEAGHALLADARVILEQVERAQRRTEAAARGELGALAIGFITPLIYSVLPALLRDFRKRFPDIRLSLREATADAQLEGLRRGALDAGFMTSPLAEASMSTRTIVREPLVAALPARHPLARSRRPVPLAALQSDPFIVFPRPAAPGLFDQLVGFCHAAGFSPRIEQEALQSQTIVGLVSAGFGVAIVPASIARLRRPGVTYRPFRERAPLVEIVLAWRQANSSAALRNFVEVAARHAA